MDIKRLKAINSHAGIGRFYAECGDHVGEIPRQDIPSPYAYSPVHPVFLYKGKPVIVVEVKHKTYAVFSVPTDEMSKVLARGRRAGLTLAEVAA